MMTKRQWAGGAAAVTAVVSLLTGVALATPGSDVVGTILARSGFADQVDLMFRFAGERPGREVLQVRDAQDTVIQQIVFNPGGQTGWHSHFGPALVLVSQGELTIYSSEDPTCSGRTYSAGQAFIDPGQGHVHLGRASQTQNTTLWVTYFDVPPGSGVRIDAADPGVCAF